MAAPLTKPLLTSAVTRALKRQPTQTALYEQVAERLRQRILGHQLGAGSWIDEQALALEFGISRTPLREALKVLATEGLITMKLRRGAYVTEVSERDLSEVFHLLALLEGDAAKTAARVATDAQIADLETLHHQLESAVTDRDRFFSANERFHMRLLEIAGNRWGEQVVKDLRKVMNRGVYDAQRVVAKRAGRLDRRPKWRPWSATPDSAPDDGDPDPSAGSLRTDGKEPT